MTCIRCGEPSARVWCPTCVAKACCSRHRSCAHRPPRSGFARSALAAAALLMASCSTSGGGVEIAMSSTTTHPAPSVTGDPLPAIESLSDVRATTSTRPPRASRSKRPAPPRATAPQPAPGPALAVQPVGSIQQAICDAFRAACAWALRVAKCESGYDPRATNGVHRGLFQISLRWHAKRIARMGYTNDQMWEVGPNIDVALAIYSEQGGGPWSCK